MQMYNGITLINPHVINNLLAQKMPPLSSEREVYRGLDLH